MRSHTFMEQLPKYEGHQGMGGLPWAEAKKIQHDAAERCGIGMLDRKAILEVGQFMLNNKLAQRKLNHENKKNVIYRLDLIRKIGVEEDNQFDWTLKRSYGRRGRMSERTDVVLVPDDPDLVADVVEAGHSDLEADVVEAYGSDQEAYVLEPDDSVTEADVVESVAAGYWGQDVVDAGGGGNSGAGICVAKSGNVHTCIVVVFGFYVTPRLLHKECTVYFFVCHVG